MNVHLFHLAVIPADQGNHSVPSTQHNMFSMIICQIEKFINSLVNIVSQATIEKNESIYFVDPKVSSSPSSQGVGEFS